MSETRAVLGVLTGGRSSRMGRPKGRLLVPGSDEPIVARLVRLGRECGLPTVLVGASDYRDLAPDIPVLADRPSGVGPLGGLGALLRYAAAHGARDAIAVACDMPYVTVETLQRLRDAAPCAVLAPVRAGRIEPFLARYDVSALEPHLVRALEDGVRSFQSLLGPLEVTELAVDDAELVDWDEPADVE